MARIHVFTRVDGKESDVMNRFRKIQAEPFQRNVLHCTLNYNEIVCKKYA